MTRPRYKLVDPDTTPYYHCVCRCVRRAFLWGEDHLTGKNYAHRKEWVVERLAHLDNIFAIDVAAYAVMSNHYHLVVRINQTEAKSWNPNDIIRRWGMLFSVPPLIQRFLQEKTTPSEQKTALTVIEEWRSRLASLSWFMRTLNEYLARKANEEDNCRGRFWEGRFHSQALLDEAALLTTMTYVDLNPVRAGEAELPETSDFTSIQQRIRQLKESRDSRADVPSLIPLQSVIQRSNKDTIPCTLEDYLNLLDWVGRSVRADKNNSIPEHAPPILARIQVDPRSLLEHIQSREKQVFSIASALGCAAKLVLFAKQTSKKFIRGCRQQHTLYLG